MIRLWVSRAGPVPVRQQLSAQLLLGILSRQLKPGERLPSVRELARRLQIHSNTVSAVYRDLAARGWVEARAGSGVFVRDFEGVRSFVRTWLEQADALGYPRAALIQELRRAEDRSSAPWLIVADPEEELARILAAEVSEATGRNVAALGTGSELLTLPPGALVFVNSGHAAHVVPLLGDTPFHQIRLKTMQDILSGAPRPEVHGLIAVVSRSKCVLGWVMPLLSALGFNRDSVLLRNPDEPEWRAGLQTCELVATDVCSRDEFSDPLRPIIFRIVAEDCIGEIRNLVTV